MRRVYASSLGYSLSFPPVSPSFLQRFSHIRSKVQESEIVNERKHVSALRLLVHTFGCIDEEIFSCFQGECGSVFDNPSSCSRTSREKILHLLRDTSRIDLISWRHIKDKPADPATPTLKTELESAGMSVDVTLSENEHADVLLTCYWVQNRLWNIALTHGYLTPTPEADAPELSFQFAVGLAERSLDLFKRFSIRSWESHGEGVVSKPSLIRLSNNLICIVLG